MAAMLDPIFLVPFLNGLLLAVVLPLLGTYSRMRGEWLASLGVTQAAAAGLLLGSLIVESATLGALVGAAIAAAAKTVWGQRSGNDSYAVMLLGGWSAALLIAANVGGGDELSRALLEGQLYFTSTGQLWGLVGLLVVTGVGIRRVSSSLLLGCLFPDRLTDGERVTRRHDLAFDVLVAVGLALAATMVGVMAAFALVFVPAWVAFRFAWSWRAAVVLSVALGVVAYTVSFAAAILFDQPYGPVLVASLLIVAGSRSVG